MGRNTALTLGIAAIVAVFAIGQHLSASEQHDTPVQDSEYSPVQLSQWYRLLRDPAAGIDGVWSTNLDVDKQQLEYRVVDKRSADALRRVVRDAGIPIDAVRIEIDPEVPVLRGS